MHMTTWSSRADITPGTISAIQAGLTVRLVMTARASLMTCRPDDPVDAIMADNVGQFSFLPVENEGRICGLYRAEQWFGREELPSRPIGQDFEPLTEDNLLGSDASILKFLTTAVAHPTRLVVSDSEVVGLVCLSDVQKLPVRAALFSVLTALEIAMARRIEETWPDDPDGWLGLLSHARRDKVEKEVKNAKQNDTFVSHIVLTQFADKATIIRKQGLVPGSRSSLNRDLRSIRTLRDALAHANHYGETSRAAREVCRTVTTILRLVSQLSGDTV